MPASVGGGITRIRRRASILDCLRGRDDPVPLADLAAALVDGTRAGRPGDGPVPGELERIRARLHHVDLPLLADARVLAYDPLERVVYPASR